MGIGISFVEDNQLASARLAAGKCTTLKEGALRFRETPCCYPAFGGLRKEIVPPEPAPVACMKNACPDCIVVMTESEG